MSSPIRAAPVQIRRWHAFQSTAEMEGAAAEAILRVAEASIARRRVFEIVLAGGETPRRVYQRLRAADTDWSAWHVYFGDERCLPVTDPDRNSMMAGRTWLDHVAIPRSQIFPIPAERGAEAASAAYAAIVSGIGLFDLVLLGLGDDGHTASLFPAPARRVYSADAATVAVFDAPKPPPQRVSLSAARLSAARHVIYLISGAAKQQAVNDWQHGAAIPAAEITPADGVDIYIDFKPSEPVERGGS